MATDAPHARTETSITECVPRRDRYFDMERHVYSRSDLLRWMRETKDLI
jgi:hypothetical protein